jgi:enoyl-CoA hydratase
MSESFTNLVIERDGPVATLYIDRPEKFNALHRALWYSIPEAVAVLDRDPAVRAIVLAGKGKVFCAGIDLPDHAGLSSGGSLSGLEGSESSGVGKRRQLYDDIRAYQRTASCFADTNKPVIAAVHGLCLGAGMDLITACDIRLAAADATFSVRETRVGIVADIGSLQRLPRIVGDGIAREWIFTGADYDARRAREVLLVNEVLPDRDALFARAQEVARAIAANSPLAVQGSKHVLGFATRRETDANLDYVALWNAAFLHSEDLGEAMRSFMEKRPARFRGQ